MKTSQSVKAVIMAVTTLCLVGTTFGSTILALNGEKKYVSENNIDLSEIKQRQINANTNTKNDYSVMSSSAFSDLNNNNIKANLNKTSSKTNKAKKEDTKQISYNLYLQGLSIEEIANERNLVKQTIENHLLECYKEDFEINLDKYIHSEYKEMIFDAFKKVGTDKLKPIKEILPPEVSYFDIKYYLICYLKNSM